MPTMVRKQASVSLRPISIPRRPGSGFNVPAASLEADATTPRFHYHLDDGNRHALFPPLAPLIG